MTLPRFCSPLLQPVAVRLPRLRPGPAAGQHQAPQHHAWPQGLCSELLLLWAAWADPKKCSAGILGARNFAGSHSAGGTDDAPNTPALLVLQQLTSQINISALRGFFFSKPFIVTYKNLHGFPLGAKSGNSTFHFRVVLARMLEY